MDVPSSLRSFLAKSWTVCLKNEYPEINAETLPQHLQMQYESINVKKQTGKARKRFPPNTFSTNSFLKWAHAYNSLVKSKKACADPQSAGALLIPDSLGEALVATARGLLPTRTELLALEPVLSTAPGGYVNITLRNPPTAQMPLAKGPANPATQPDRFAGRALYAMQSIGAFSSCFQEKYGTPRQGQVTSFSRGRLQLHSHISPDALAGLDQYSHVWLVFVFDLNDGVGDGVAHSGRGGRFKAKVRAPRLRGGKLGVFATRTPHRVNPIGLSLARLDRIVGGTLHLSGVDLVSGTPVLDLKPYHPADAVPSATARVPQWMHDAPPALRASFHRSAERQLLSLFQDDKQPQPVLDFYDRYDDIHQAILQVIRADPRTTHSHNKHRNGVFGVMLDRLDVSFRIIPRHHQQGGEGGQQTERLCAEEEGFCKRRKVAAGLAAGAGLSGAPGSGEGRVLLEGPAEHGEAAQIFHIRHYQGGQKRRRLRTEEWFAEMTSYLGQLDSN